MQLDSDKLKADNTNLVAAYREKARKHQQTQELYDRLKRKEQISATQSAAIDSVDDILNNSQSRQEYGGPALSHQYSATRTKSRRLDLPPIHLDHNGIEQVHSHQRSGSNNSGGSGGLMPPPPLRRPAGISNSFNHGKSY